MKKIQETRYKIQGISNFQWEKSFIYLVLAICFLGFTPSGVSAHLAGQPPFFRINNVYSSLYPVPSTSLNDFELPQDLAAENYLVGQELEMEIDKSQIPVLPDVVAQTQFFWDFGDGQKAQGLKNNHTYTKAGTYIMKIDAQYQSDQPQLIQSTMIHILPSGDYKLPVAKIAVNGVESKDPLLDVLKFDFSNSIAFASDKSEATGKIVSYFWDFGDGQSSKEKNPQHKYTFEDIQLFPVLRIQDENGFIADAYVSLEDQEEDALASVVSPGFLEKYKIPIALWALVIIIGAVFFIVRKNGNKSSKN